MPLPDLLPFSGDWSSYEDDLYRTYLSGIVNANLSFNGLPIKCQYRPSSKNKHFGFWHVISEGNVEDDRLPDLRRCERIRWIAYLIAYAGTDTEISWWENKRGSNTHVVIWHERENFAVILAKRSDFYLLKSAYCAQSHRKKMFIKEREEFWGGYKG
ncbi:hypothetical protein A1507_15410 [Methylomonas koyamae]|uniref:Uncharacterized protein n=1 Tax=Methylomonas koyamae TaxID=702114 RepID=A0A177NA02_9GAMM|nr:hypothetical protein [Methylomonas koyamae]OAI14424.1 hypothetical protein A1507_15410 [Methylomonas koyamae]